MLPEKVEKAFCDQVTAELYSAYLYAAMSAWFAENDLPGFANWMRIQAREEMTHAMKFYDHVLERGGSVNFGAIDAPPSEWDSPKAAFEAVLAHEQKVTGLINDLMNLAQDERDHASRSFLQWFVDEQVEEEDSARTVLSQLKLVEGAPGALYMMDKEMAARVFNPPPGEPLA